MAKGQKSPIASVPPGKDDALIDAQEVEEYDELSEEERLAVHRRCLRFLDAALLVCCAALCGGALYCTNSILLDSFGPTLVYAAAGVSGAIFAATIVGLLSILGQDVKPGVLLTYFTFIVVLSFGMLVIGGFCFILFKSSQGYLESNWDRIYASLTPSARAGLTLSGVINKTRAALYGVGAGCFAVFLLSVAAMNQAIALVSASRAYTVFLQATNVAMLPVGVALIAAAAYVADTAVSAETAIAAFAIFILGIFVIVLVLLGCVGTSLQSRGVVRLFMILTFLLSFGFISFGVLALVQADLVSQLITNQWETLRRVLPPDFAGKYDKEQFTKFIDANLVSLGFLAVVSAVVLVSQTWASMRLRAELKYESEAEQEAWEAVREGLLPAEVAESLSKESTKSKAQIMWKQQWTKGSSRSRLVIKVGCICLAVLVAAAIALAAVAVYYSTSCVKLGKYAETGVYSISIAAAGGASVGGAGSGESSAAVPAGSAGYVPASFHPVVYVRNNYTLGATVVKVDTSISTRSAQLFFKKAAFKQEMATAGWPAVVNVSVRVPADAAVFAATGSTEVDTRAIGIVALDRGPTSVLGYDVSCQNDEATVVLPPAGVYSGGLGNSRLAGDAAPLVLDLASGAGEVGAIGSAGVSLDFAAAQAPDKPRIRFARLRTGAGPLIVDGALIGSKGIVASTGSGEISISRTAVECDPADVGASTGGVRLSTDKGAILVDGLAATDCDVYVVGAAALTSVTNTTVRNALGGGKLTLVGSQGIMSLSKSSIQAADVMGDEGSVRLADVGVGEALRVSTKSGAVAGTALRFARRAVLQVETDSGGVDLYASEFRGIVSIITGGPINCVTTAPTGFRRANPCTPTAGGTAAAGGAQTLTLVDSVEVNCASEECPYLGQITVTSTRGGVTLRFDKVNN